MSSAALTLAVGSHFFPLRTAHTLLQVALSVATVILAVGSALTPLQVALFVIRSQDVEAALIPNVIDLTHTPKAQGLMEHVKSSPINI